jgi:hypothetical protein
MVNSFLTMLHFLVVALAGHAKSAPQPCPLYAQKRTLIDNFSMSVKGHKPTLVDGAATRISANHPLRNCGPQGRGNRSDGQDYVRWCFANNSDAEAVCEDVRGN